MCRAIVSVMLLSLMLAVGAPGQIPPKYEIVQLTENSYFEYGPAMNNCGQVVFTRRVGAGSNHLADEIFLYSDGELIRLTNDDVRDAYPDINDDGTIVWSRGIGPDGPYGSTLEIMIYQDGDLTRLTDNTLDDTGPSINNLGHIIWSQWVRGGCHDANAVICFHDGSTIEQISDADWSHQGAVINDDDWIAWTRYNFCDDPWTSDIMLFADGVTTRLTDGQLEPQMPAINNAGEVVWQYYDPQLDRKGLQIWQDGNATTLTDWGMNARINDHGDVYFIRWYDYPGVYQPWLYMNQVFYRLSDDAFWSIDGDINNLGETVWPCGEPPWGFNMHLLQRFLPDGDGTGPQLDPLQVRPAVLP